MNRRRSTAEYLAHYQLTPKPAPPIDYVRRDDIRALFAAGLLGAQDAPATYKRLASDALVSAKVAERAGSSANYSLYVRAYKLRRREERAANKAVDRLIANHVCKVCRAVSDTPNAVCIFCHLAEERS